MSEEPDWVELHALRTIYASLIEVAELQAAAPAQILPALIRLIITAKKIERQPNVEEDAGAFRETLEEIAKSVWSPDEAALAQAALNAAKDRESKRKVGI